MLSYKILDLTNGLMVFSVVYLLGSALQKRWRKESEHTFFQYAKFVLLLLGVIMLIWLLCNKELFHWHFDIATGEPVDHYSTYSRCVANTIISLLSNSISAIMSIKKKQ